MCDDQIAQENDHLKREIKKLELEVNKLKKQTKVQPPQDNRYNVVKKLEKKINRTKDCFSTSMEATSKWEGWKSGICKECLLECKKATYQEWNWIQKWWQAQL
jgi:sugar-specific transcriptional regulator TrmB